MKQKKQLRDNTIGENFFYSYLVLGILVFAFGFIIWRFDWLMVRLWIVFSFLLFMFVEINDRDKYK